MAKKKKEVVLPPKPFGDYLIVNHDKLERAINGTGKNPGVGQNATPESVLAEYDRLGGLILKQTGEKVAMGSFWDFEWKKPREFAIVKEVKKPGKGRPRLKVKQTSGVEDVKDDE